MSRARRWIPESLVLAASLTACGSTACQDDTARVDDALGRLQAAMSAEATDGDGYSEEERERVRALATRIGLARAPLAGLAREGATPSWTLVDEVLADARDTRLARDATVRDATAALARARAACGD